MSVRYAISEQDNLLGTCKFTSFKTLLLLQGIKIKICLFSVLFI